MQETNHPKIGIALSGASGRAIAHIGVLEVLREHKIPIDYIVGCSSGAMIAASFATGTMEQLKQYLLSSTFQSLFILWSTKNTKSGLFNFDKADSQISKYTKGFRFEDVNPKLGFVTSDLNSGELVTLGIGDMTWAVKASCAVPGLFEPMIWGNKILVDGGLFNIVPTLPAKQMGSDIVIGVNIAATKFVLKKQLPIWRGYRFLTRILGLQFLREKVFTKLASRILFQFDTQSDVLDQKNVRLPGALGILAKSLDWADKISQQWKESNEACDLMLEPRVKQFGPMDFANLRTIYEEGRQCTQEAIPEIKKLIENYGIAPTKELAEESKGI